MHRDAYLSDFHYLQEATETGSASSFGTKVHRWNFGKGQQDEEIRERGRESRSEL